MHHLKEQNILPWLEFSESLENKEWSQQRDKLQMIIQPMSKKLYEATDNHP